MNYIELTIGEKDYKLRLTTRSCISMEKTLGYNPIEMFLKMDDNTLPKLTDLVVIFHAMLQAYQHNINLEATYDIFDEYMAEGNTMFDIIPIFVQVFQECGFLAKTANNGEEIKNA